MFDREAHRWLADMQRTRGASHVARARDPLEVPELGQVHAGPVGTGSQQTHLLPPEHEDAGSRQLARGERWGCSEGAKPEADRAVHELELAPQRIVDVMTV